MATTETTASPLGFKPRWLSNESYSMLIILASSCIYSIMGCFIQLAANTGIPSTELVFIRAAFQGTFVVLAMILCREEGYLPMSTSSSKMKIATTTTSNSENNNLQPRHGRRLILSPLGDSSMRSIVIARGAVGGFGFVLYFYTISVLPLGDAVALLSLHPIVTVFAAAALLGEPVRTVHIIASFATVTGSFLIAKPAFLFGEQKSEDHPENYDPFGYVTAAMGTCAGAGVFILIRKAGESGAHTLQLLFSWVCFGLFFSLVLGIFLPFGQGSWDFPSSRLAWLYTFACCSFGSVGHFLLNFAARHSNPALASIVRSSGIMWAYLLQIAFFNQIPTLLTCAGVVLVSSSLIMVSVQKYFDSKETEGHDTEQDDSLEYENDSDVEEQELVPSPSKLIYDGIDSESSMEAKPLTSD